MILYTFTLGREWKLSLAELFSLFGQDAYVTHSETVAIFALPNEKDDIIAIFRNIGGSIRAMEILGETTEEKFPTDIISHIGKPDGKYTFALGAYGLEYRLSDIGLRIKKTLTEKGASARLVNTENKNINAATWKKERLGRSLSEYNLVKVGEKIYISRTLSCQDIDAYARRDTGKSRDMVVGMMPPKLVQMMLNLANGKVLDEVRSFSEISVYDPFCGLGTTLIEAMNMGYSHVIGSDLSADMVRATRSSIDGYIADERMWQDRIRKAGGTPMRDVETIETDVFELDATRIYRYFEGKRLDDAIIVSEGYLGEIMMKGSITLDRVKEERRKLMRMYDSFFHGLANLSFTGNIVMTFPFWDVHGTYSYFTEIYDVIESAGFEIVSLLPPALGLCTRKGSLLYRRPGQNVGREVIKMRLKKN